MDKNKPAPIAANDEEIYLTVQEIGDLLGIGRTRLYEMLNTPGFPPAFRIPPNGRKRHYEKCAVLQWVKDNAVRDIPIPTQFQAYQQSRPKPKRPRGRPRKYYGPPVESGDAAVLFRQIAVAMKPQAYCLSVDISEGT